MSSHSTFRGVDDGAEENAATRWVRDSVARLMAQDDPTRTFSGWAADGYQHEDRTSHPLLGGEAGREASDTMERRWRANFDLGRDLSAADAGAHEVVAQHGEHLTMLRWTWRSDFFDSDALWVYELDSTLTRLRRTIQFDSNQLADALEVFRELADTP